MQPRSVLAPNPSPLTLDGTRTYLVGRERIAIIDPGPPAPEHLDAVAEAIGDGVVVALLLTHTHPDHAAGAIAFERRFGAPLLFASAGSLAPGQRTETDAGGLVAVPTPGHTPDHVAFHWPEADAVFCGDLMLGGLETALVAAPEGNLRDYLTSLERLRGLEPRVIYPAHGPAFVDAPAALAAYVRHREERRAQVLAALRGGAATHDEIVSAVYGPELPVGLRSAAEAAVGCYLENLEDEGRIELAGGGWRALTAE